MQWKVGARLGIRGRLFSLVLLFGVGCSILAGLLIFLQAQRAYSSRMLTLQQLVATAHGVLEAHKKLADSGQMPVEEARKRALNVIRSMWFGKSDYFTARDTNGISLLNPAAPEKEGKNRDEATDSHGHHYSREMTELVRGPGEGYVTYYTEDPETKQDAQKTTYIKLYKPWGIAIAAGVFTHDIDIETRSSVLNAAAITFLLICLLGGIAVWQAQVIVGSLGRLRGAMLELAKGRLDGIKLETSRHDELGEMARAVQVFQENAIRARQLQDEANEARSEADSERARSEVQRLEFARQTETAISVLAGGLTQLASGNLTARLGDVPDTYRQLQADFNGAVAKLEAAFAAVSRTSASIHSGSGELSKGAADLSKRTEQQAANLEETAAALEQITATVKKTAEGAQHAREVVLAAKSGAEGSGRVVRDAVQAMGEIEKSSTEISQIIGVIDEIAFQTNLLALNAGVEAARAGEAGRGFAVVASEVRALAQRSADSAKQIRNLISASTDQVATGVILVGEAGDALRQIVSQVANVTQIVSEIAASTQEQATGLGQVNTAVSQLDEITQQNAAMAEETTAAMASLSQDADEMQQLLATFRVADGRGDGPLPRGHTSMTAANVSAKPAGARRLMGRLAAAFTPKQQAASWEEF